MAFVVEQRKNLNRNVGVSNSSSYNPKKQVDNYKTRFKAAGVDTNAVTDKRNWLEKALNLEQDQNFLFDIFEILGRPQNALFTGIANAQSGESFGQGLLEGIKGETKTSGKDLLLNAGMEEEDGKLDLTDVLGFGLDVFADPIDLALIPVTAGGSVAAKAGASGAIKGTKAIDTATNIAKAAKAADTASDIAKGAKAIDTATDAAKTIKWVSPSELLFRGAGKGVKKVAGLADTGIEKVLGKIDAKQLKNIEKVAKETGDSVDNIIRQVGGKSDLLGDYKALKKAVSNTIDNSKRLGGLVEKTKRSANSVELADAIARAKANDLKDMTRKVADEIASKTGENADDLAQKLSKNLTRYIEFEQDTAIDGANFLQKLSSKSNKFEGTKESVQALSDALGKYDNIKFKVASDGKSLVIDTKKSKYLQSFKDNPEVQKVFKNLNLNKDLGYSPEQIKELKEIGKSFGKGGNLENLYQSHKKAYNEISDIYKKYAGVDFSDITKRQGYLKRALGDLDDADTVGLGLARGTTDTRSFSSRKHTAPAEVENVRREEKRLADIKKTEKNIEAATKQLSENKKVMLTSQKEAVEIKKAQKLKKFNENLAKAGEKQAKIKNGLDNIAKMRDDIVTKLDDKTIKNIEKIKDTTVSTSISKASTDVNNLTKEYNDLVKKLSDTDLTEKEIKTLSKKVDTLSTKMEVAQRKLNVKLDAVNDFTKNRTDVLLKNTHKALEKSENIAVKESKLTSQLGETLEKTKQLRQAQEDTIEHLDKVINNLDLQIKGINPENDKKILEKIKKLENKKVILASQEGKELFNLDYYAGLDTFINQASDTAKGVSIYRDALATEALYNKNYIKFAEDLVDGEIPRGFTKVNGDVLANQFDNIKNFLPENSDALKLLAEDFKGKTLYLDKDFARLMNVTKNSKEQANALVKMVDNFNNLFKKYKILTPGFQLRNIAGNATNMVLSGMPANKIPGYYAKAKGVLDSADDLLTKVSKGIELTGKDADNWKLLQQFYEGGFKDAGTKLQDLEQLRARVQGKKGPLNWLTEKNAKLNESVDALNRMSLLMYANDNPKYIQKLGKKDAVEAVKYALMDPSNMSDFEKSAMKRIIPFYTFTKQNLLFQASNMMNNTPKYHRLMKAINSTYKNLGENEYYNYQKEGMQIPLPVTDDNGNRLFLKTNLPLSDLGEWMSHPVQRTLSSTSPLIRTPFEMVTGKSIYTGKDNYTSKAEQILSGLGIDTISTNLLKKVTAAVKTYKGDMDSQAMWAEIFRSILQNTNQEKIENSRAYEDLEAYQEYIKQLKNQGINVPTIRDLNNQSKRTLRTVKNKRNSR